MDPYSVEIRKISLQKVDLAEDYTQKVQENFKKRSTSDTIGDPLLTIHPVNLNCILPGYFNALFPYI